MASMTKGSMYRCTKEGCGVQVEIAQQCQSGEDCNLSCCGQKMKKM